MQNHNGNAVLVSFVDIQSLIGFIEQLLMNSLKLKPTEQFELVPIFISEQRCGNIKQVMDTSFTEIGMVDDSNQENSAKQHIHIGASTHTNAQNIETGGKSAVISMHARAMDSYFADQKNRDREYRGKRSLNQNDDACSNNTRKDFMRNYMQKRRNIESFRINDNLKAAERIKRIVGTDEERQKHNKRSVEGMRKILSTEEGRKKHNERSAERMRKVLSTEEGKRET